MRVPGDIRGKRRGNCKQVSRIIQDRSHPHGIVPGSSHPLYVPDGDTRSERLSLEHWVQGIGYRDNSKDNKQEPCMHERKEYGGKNKKFYSLEKQV